MSAPNEQGQASGYGRPPVSGRFKTGTSGNPKGRPRGRKSSVPYDTVLGQMVTIREDGRQRRVTAAEAFILQLTKKGLAGDSAAARSSLAAIEAARASRSASGQELPTIRLQARAFGLCCSIVDLGLGVLLNPHDKQRVRLMLKPWIVDAALSRLGSRRLSPEEQSIVLASTRNPEQVSWPEWWDTSSLEQNR
ncbi:DUF5681 domain-containing protein [Sphingomonas glaciei]|uniref:DUF5681 domain-containing protein n=1 Tax=Sphingomonas glaciei TaxID=2938948 RepID=A0ABY5MVX6_9SPHN|nr:DUF5681 domain-containing protein [Sphingomonas glaciei]UUR08136.1 DUF5681 domain-containing protein [Sphingomonas glaciei]